MEPYLNLRSPVSEAANASLDPHTYVGITREDIVVDQVEPFGWCVRDGRFPEDDRSAVIGFIEEDNDLYEVMQLGDRVRLLSFPSLDDAIQHLSEHAMSAGPTAG